MAVINYITRPDYINWIEKFICKVLEHADIHFSNVIIDSISFNGIIYINVDNIQYYIMILNSKSIKYDDYSNSCYKNISYELYRMTEDEIGSHGECICDEHLEICVKN